MVVKSWLPCCAVHSVIVRKVRKVVWPMAMGFGNLSLVGSNSVRDSESESMMQADILKKINIIITFSRDYYSDQPPYQPDSEPRDVEVVVYQALAGKNLNGRLRESFGI